MARTDVPADFLEKFRKQFAEYVECDFNKDAEKICSLFDKAALDVILEVANKPITRSSNDNDRSRA